MTNLEWLISRDPIHIGGADSSSRGNSNPIFRLPDRTPVIPGSSLRGALREGAAEDNVYNQYVYSWFGGSEPKSSETENSNSENQNSTNQEEPDNEEPNNSESLAPGSIALGWCWPIWWPVHVLGYGNWWVTCPAWLKRFWQLQKQHNNNFTCNSDDVYWTNETLKAKEIYFRWLKLTEIKEYKGPELPFVPGEIDSERCLIVPDDKINLFVDMGLVRQPRVSLKTREDYWEEQAKKLAAKKNNQPSDDDDDSLVDNLFSVEGIPPGAIFFFAWITRKQKAPDNLEQWEKFLRDEHYLGGLWGIGYGRVSILQVNNQDPQSTANASQESNQEQANSTQSKTINKALERAEKPN